MSKKTIRFKEKVGNPDDFQDMSSVESYFDSILSGSKPFIPDEPSFKGLSGIIPDNVKEEIFGTNDEEKEEETNSSLLSDNQISDLIDALSDTEYDLIPEVDVPSPNMNHFDIIEDRLIFSSSFSPPISVSLKEVPSQRYLPEFDDDMYGARCQDYLRALVITRAPHAIGSLMDCFVFLKENISVKDNAPIKNTKDLLFIYYQLDENVFEPENILTTIYCINKRLHDNFNYCIAKLMNDYEFSYAQVDYILYSLLKEAEDTDFLGIEDDHYNNFELLRHIKRTNIKRSTQSVIKNLIPLCYKGKTDLSIPEISKLWEPTFYNKYEKITPIINELYSLYIKKDENSYEKLGGASNDDEPFHEDANESRIGSESGFDENDKSEEKEESSEGQTEESEVRDQYEENESDEEEEPERIEIEEAEEVKEENMVIPVVKG